MQRRFLAKLVNSSFLNYTQPIPNPCFFNGYNVTVTSDYLWGVPCSSGKYARDYLGEDIKGPPNKTYIITGSGSFSQCYNLVDQLINASNNCTRKDSLCGIRSNVYQ